MASLFLIAGEAVPKKNSEGAPARSNVRAIVSTEEIERPFESIESAHEYMDILAATALEALAELKRDRDQALRDGDQRRAKALELAMFKLKMLGCHVFKSRRMLNDLRILRRLILNERSSVESAIATM